MNTERFLYKLSGPPDSMYLDLLKEAGGHVCFFLGSWHAVTVDFVEWNFLSRLAEACALNSTALSGELMPDSYHETVNSLMFPYTGVLPAEQCYLFQSLPENWHEKTEYFEGIWFASHEHPGSYEFVFPANIPDNTRASTIVGWALKHTDSDSDNDSDSDSEINSQKGENLQQNWLSRLLTVMRGVGGLDIWDRE